MITLTIHRAFTALLVSALVAGCANTGSNYRPMIDSKGVDFNKYESDLRECQAYADQTYGAGSGAAAGAAIGAVFGAVLAAAAGSRYDRSATARVGGVSGAAGGAIEGEENQRNVIRRCLQGRGYTVLQ